jgi:NADH:ubiquinone oxidoreductase subunit H
LTFYLVEYFHLIISANHFTICFLGGWSGLNLWSIIPIINVYYNDVFCLL